MDAKPWLENEEWTDGVVRSDARKGTRLLWLFAILWNLIALPVCFVLPREITHGNYAALFVLLFPAVGMGMLAWAWNKGREWKYFGVTELRLDPFPGSIGGQIGGTVQINRPFRDPEFEVTIQSVYSYVSGSGNNRSRNESIKWQVKGKPEIERTPTGVRLIFCFDVAEGLHASETPASSYYFWRLQVRDSSDTDGIRLNRSFTLPVFETREPARHISVNTGDATRNAMSDQLNGDPAELESLQEEHGFILERRGEWLRLFYPAGRQKTLAVMMFVAGLVFGGGGVFMNSEGAIFIGSIFCFFGALLLAIALYVPFNSLDVRISAREIYSRRKWMGMNISRRTFAPAQIRSLKTAQGSSTSSTSGTVIRYKVAAKLNSGKSVTLSEGIVGQLAAEAVRDLILESAGLLAVKSSLT